MNPLIPYLACLIGAAALYLLLRPGTQPIRTIAVIVGLGAFAWLLAEAGRLLMPVGPGEPVMRPEAIFLIFSLIAVASAVRMITHHRPVYSALYFVMVVLSSAGLFLLLRAEFMAFALIIVYAGAILITYMFVLMLAQQAPSATGTPGAAGGEAAAAQPEYDRVPREPGMAAAVGFIMLALFTHMIFEGLPGLIARAPEEAPPLLADVEPTNIHLVGLDLVAAFPVSLELAGIILLLAMFGAVVLARKQIELGEDEVREAAGMRRLALHTDEPPAPPAGPPGGER